MSLESLKKQRAALKGQLTRLFTAISDTPDMSMVSLETRKIKVEQLYDSFSSIQLSIESEDTVSDHDTERDNFERQYYLVADLIGNRMKAFRDSLSSNTSLRNVDSPNTVLVKQANVLLPKIEIKPFDGNPIEWHSFRDTFQSLVHDNEELPGVQKFHFLKNALRGEVASVIAALNASESNYLVAWDLLQRRCNKPRQIINAHLKLLFELPEVTRDSPTNLRLLAEQAQMHVNALKSLEQPVQHWDTVLVYVVAKKLDKNTRRAWERTLENEQIPEFEQLISFISRQSRGEEFDSDYSHIGKLSHDKNLRNRAVNRGQVYLATKDTQSCALCKERHMIYNCVKFANLSVRDRLDAAKKARLCLNCLSFNHFANNCKFSNCKKCNRKHHTLLHFPVESCNTIPREKEESPSPTNSIESSKTALTVTLDEEVLLGTAIVRVLDRDNNEQFCRVLLDSGSQAHIMTESFADKLRLKKHDIDLSFYGLNRFKSQAKHFVKTTIRSRASSFATEVTFITLPAITGLLPASEMECNLFNIPKGVKLADSEFYKPRMIDALLGNSLFYRLLRSGQFELCGGSIILQNTLLGWLVTGSNNWQRSFSYVEPSQSCHLVATSLEKCLKSFWELEEVSNKQVLSSEEIDCEKHFVEHTTRDELGRFVVSLPFNELQHQIGESRNSALKRFFSLERKLQKNTILLKQYKEFLQEYAELGHMSEVDQCDEDHSGFYLPHHAVIKESSATTKVRVVFDASAKSSTGVSLNDALLKGPIIQDSLWSILIRFRMHVFVLTADIEKMFRQILVRPEDTVYQKILWRDSVSDQVRTFKLNTVTYGTTSAPFLAVRCLKQLAEDELSKFPMAAQIFKRDFYVDDLLTGVSNFEEAVKLRKELIALARLGGFHLRQWASNDAKLIDDIPTEDNQKALCLDSNMVRKTLGVFWNSTTDNVIYTVKPFSNLQSFTKRIILSQIAQLFDPFGLLGPVIIKAKIFMQQLWKASIDWDEVVPQKLHKSWLEFRNELHFLNNFSAPRKVIIDQATRLEIHGFCDASESAYGACIYIRSSNRNSEHSVNLLCAKSRVAPVKIISLPRLELCAARLLARLYVESVKALMNIKFHRVRFWSDSSITLQWIRTAPHTLKTFVANRVSEIQNDTNPQLWCHVATFDNPADYISRGQLPSEFINNDDWLKGPHWLGQDEKAWPVSKIVLDDVPEKRNIVSLIVHKAPNELLLRYSSIVLLNRVVAYILRFYYNLKHEIKVKGELTSHEINKAHMIVLREMQAEAFAPEIDNLKKAKPISKGSKVLNLNPFLDEDGLLRVDGRLKHAPLSYSQKHPVLLPRRHHITDLIVRHAHLRSWHAGTQATLNAVRQNYWPIDGKNMIKRIVHKCVRCCKLNHKSPNYIMGNLPLDRITQTRPFQVTGIDYCGPFHIKEKKFRNRSKVKVYVAIFVCFASKAVHLELVTDLTAESCLAALRRFFGRRGKSQKIYTDNGTNFVGAKNEIMELQAFLSSDDYRSRVQHFLSDENVEWHFSPPRSPHFGGLWEAAVKAFKNHLYRTVGDELFTYEQFNTLIIEIEAILNSRPLIPLSSDPNDLIALTPGHFLIGNSLYNLPEHDLLDVKNNKLSAWQHIQKVKQHFWSRWHKEYLQILHTRKKWHLGDATQFKKGILVVIREDNTPPLHWKLGRIIDIHPGEDDVVRVVTVRTAQGIYKRSVKRLSPLPIEGFE